MLINYRLFVRSYLGKVFRVGGKNGDHWTVKHSIKNLKHKEPEFVCKLLDEKEPKFATFKMSTIRTRMI